MSASVKRELAKTKKILHPNSRKSVAIAKKATRINHKQRAKLGAAIKQNLVGEKMLWVQQHMDHSICPYTPELAANLLKMYIARHNEELEQIALKHSIGGRKNRQHASREDVLRISKEREQNEYDTCGIEIPDILNPSQCRMLQEWNGELKFLPNFKFRRFGKKHLMESIQRQNKLQSSVNSVNFDNSVTLSDSIVNTKDLNQDTIEDVSG